MALIIPKGPKIKKSGKPGGTFNGDNPTERSNETPDEVDEIFRLSWTAGFLDLGASVNLGVIHNLQSKLLPMFQALRDEAYETLSQNFTVLPNYKCNVRLDIVYRRPDNSREIMPHLEYIEDYPVVVPLRRDSVPVVANEFVAAGKLTVSQRRFGKPTGLAALATVQALDRMNPAAMSDSSATLAPTRVVFPNTLDRMMFWMREIDGTIHRMRISPTHPEKAQRVLQASTFEMGSRA